MIIHIFKIDIAANMVTPRLNGLGRLPVSVIQVSLTSCNNISLLNSQQVYISNL